MKEIEQGMQAPAPELSLVAAQERLKAGRNERCPCGSGRKYKKCCLRADEEIVQREAALQLQSRAGCPNASAAEESTGAAGDGVRRRPARAGARPGGFPKPSVDSMSYGSGSKA